MQHNQMGNLTMPQQLKSLKKIKKLKKLRKQPNEFFLQNNVSQLSRQIPFQPNLMNQSSSMQQVCPNLQQNHPRNVFFPSTNIMSNEYALTLQGIFFLKILQKTFF